MKTLISPSKSVTEKDLPIQVQATRPIFGPETAELVSELQRVDSIAELGQVLDVSENLAALNLERFQNWDDPDVRRPAIWMYSGDVYNGLDAFTLDANSAQRMQDDLLIISGLYGLVRPFDLVQPYRLEMRIKLSGGWGKNLYTFWGSKLAEHIERSGAETMLVCASREYSRAVVPKLSSDLAVVTPRFLQPTRNGLKEKSLFAKHGRGVLARWVVDNQIEDPAELDAFDVDGFRYCLELSTPQEPVYLVPDNFSLAGRFTRSY